MELKDLKEKRQNISSRAQKVIESVDVLAEKSARVANVAHDSQKYLDEIDSEFERITALNDTDVKFMLLATMLQSLRWILMPELKLLKIDQLSPSIPKEERLRANEKAHVGGIYDGKASGAEYELDELSKYREKHSKKAEQSKDRFYKKEDQFRGWIEILTQPVPYDAMNGLDKNSIPNIANLNLKNKNGLFNNIYAKNHHVATLGHDPILGWIFGTANIMTSTISFVDFQNFEVKRGHKVKSLGGFVENRELQFSDQVIDFLTPRGLTDIFGECFMSTKEDYKRLGAAVVRQAIHIQSDKYCIEGLPIPIISVVDAQKAQKLIEEGWNSVEFGRLLKGDLKQIGISAALSALINLIIEAIYLLCIKSDDELDFRRVKVKKIQSISGVIASTSNVLYTCLTENYSKLDIGGMGVTMLTLLNSVDFKYKIKEEYVKNKFSELVMEI